MGRREIKAHARLVEEHVWFEQGYQAWYGGLDLKDWPRPEKKYCRSWYRIKGVWQSGWLTAAGQAVSEHTPDRTIPPNPKPLKDRLYLLILKHPGIQVRQILRMLSSADYEDAKTILREWEEMKAIKLLGNGIKGNPVTIELCD